MKSAHFSFADKKTCAGASCEICVASFDESSALIFTSMFFSFLKAMATSWTASFVLAATNAITGSLPLGASVARVQPNMPAATRHKKIVISRMGMISDVQLLDGVLFQDLGNVPQRDVAIDAAGSQDITGRRECNGLKSEDAFFHPRLQFAGFEIPEVQRAVTPC